MEIGSLLVGVAVTLVVGACLARPFRRAWMGAGLDRVIDAWVAQVRAEWKQQATGSMRVRGRSVRCQVCGRPAAPHERTCAACGASLDGELV